MVLDRTVQLCLTAAEGWLELGSPAGAHEEIALLEREHASLPEVREMRCRIFAVQKNWDAVLPWARALCDEHPRYLAGWLHQARALHERGKTHEAYHLLVYCVCLFPDNQTIRYDIACYAAQRGLVSEAAQWLQMVLAIDGDDYYRQLALREPMLAPVLHGVEVAIH